MFAYNPSKGVVTNMVRPWPRAASRQSGEIEPVGPDMQAEPELMAKFRERMSLGTPARPKDIAAVLAFRASDDARVVTGVSLPVDGGLIASNEQPAQ